MKTTIMTPNLREALRNLKEIQECEGAQEEIKSTVLKRRNAITKLEERITNLRSKVLSLQVKNSKARRAFQKLEMDRALREQRRFNLTQEERETFSAIFARL